MGKVILSSDESKQIAYMTLNNMANVVGQTLGPGGNPIILQRQGQNPDGTAKPPLITKDGVTVCEGIQFSDQAQDTVAKAVLQVAQSTVNSVGDGTSTSVILADAIFKAGFKSIEKGANGIQLYNELKQIKDYIVNYIDEIKTEVSVEDVKDVARVSANGDEEVAEVVYKAISMVGEDGHVSLEEGYSRDTVVDNIDGAVYKQGWRGFGPHGSLLVTDKAKNVAELENPAVLLYAGKLDSVHEIADFIHKLMGKDPNTNELTNIIPLVIIAHDYSDEVKNFIVQNKHQVKLPLAAIKSPFDGSPNARTEMLEDLAVLLGGSVAAKGILELDAVSDEHLGCASKISIGDEETVVYGGQGDSEAIVARVTDLKTRAESLMYDYDKENVRLRIGKLTGGISIVRVGGGSELEMREKKDRIEDALCAAKVAIQDGIVPGGGTVLYRYSKTLKGDTLASKIMKEALVAPIKRIISNVGENPEVVLSHLNEDAEYGYDAKNKEQVSMRSAGIVDPAKVTKSAVENAVSIAGLLLTTGGSIVLDGKEKSVNPMAAMMGLS